MLRFSHISVENNLEYLKKTHCRKNIIVHVCFVHVCSARSVINIFNTLHCIYNFIWCNWIITCYMYKYKQTLSYILYILWNISYLLYILWNISYIWYILWDTHPIYFVIFIYVFLINKGHFLIRFSYWNSVFSVCTCP